MKEQLENKKTETFQDLLVWQKGIKLVKEIYLITKEIKLSQAINLKEQLESTSISIPTSIAEGFNRYSQDEYLKFLKSASGYVGKLCTLLRIVSEIGYLEPKKYEQIFKEALELNNLLSQEIHKTTNYCLMARMLEN